jgi:hypothetical protein
MAPSSDQERIFRLMDLPAELRNNVYALLLCAFEKPLTAFSPTSTLPGPTSSSHTVDARIIRTNSQIHRDAYDVMVKRNCLVRFEYTGNFIYPVVLMNNYLPIVTAKKASISRFEGFAMTISCSAHLPENEYEDEDEDFRTRQNVVMIRAQDSHSLCNAMADAATACADRNGSLYISLEVAPVLKVKSRRYKPSFGEFFSQATHERLPLPYRRGLRSVKSFEIHGKAVPDKLAQDIREEVAQYEWADPEGPHVPALGCSYCEVQILKNTLMALAAMTGNGENEGRFNAGALDSISKALQLLPNDSVPLREHDALLSCIDYAHARAIYSKGWVENFMPP